MTQTSPAPPSSPAQPSIEAGEYFSTDRELYRVERIVADRVLLEDCRTETLIEVGIDLVRAMRPITRER